MKSERRHELETNSLALWLRFRAPELAQQHGSKVLLGIIVLALAVVLIRNRMEAPRRAAANAANYLASARNQIDELRGGARLPNDTAVIITQIRTAMEQSDDPVIQAGANLAMGDYYWALINWPDIPAAATQPQFKPAEPRQELISKAEEAYRRVLNVSGAKPHMIAAARFGLAAIEETRGFEQLRDSMAKESGESHWKAAREHYQAIIDAPETPAILKDQAKLHLDRLPELQQPVWIVAATQPATTQEATTQQAATMPATTGPATRPATQP